VKTEKRKHYRAHTAFALRRFDRLLEHFLQRLRLRGRAVQVESR
jgi:hypothetical protein